jgi:hypothetical protein
MHAGKYNICFFILLYGRIMITIGTWRMKEERMTQERHPLLGNCQQMSTIQIPFLGNSLQQ